MIRGASEVLSEKKGAFQAMGIAMMGLLLLAAMGTLAFGFAVTSQQNADAKVLNQAMSGRAQEYAAALNTGGTPDLGKRCTERPTLCTTVTSIDGEGDELVVVVEGSAEGPTSKTITKEIELHATAAAYVTEIDERGGKFWGTTTQAMPHYRIWSLSEDSDIFGG